MWQKRVGWELPGSGWRVARRRMKITEAAEVLGVSPDIQADELKATYRRLAIKWHPDKCKDCSREEATAKFQQISQAYKCLERYVESGENGDSEEDDDMGMGGGFDPMEMFEMMFMNMGGLGGFGRGGAGASRSRRGGGGFRAQQRSAIITNNFSHF